jgi:hypothetical protein
MASLAQQREHAMLKIERHCEECVTRLRLSGRIQSDQIACIQSAMNDNCAILDLSEVTLVDLGVVRFLSRCEDKGIELVQCPPYVLQWIHRERAESAQSEPSHSD